MNEKTLQFANQENTRAFWKCFRGVHGPTFQIQASLGSSDGAILFTDKETILQPWAEH